VVINGGAFVLPFIHDYTPVNMNVLQMEIVREKADALITKDRMRVDIEAEFYVRVKQSAEAVSIAGRDARPPHHGTGTAARADLGKFVSALRSVASEMTMEEMHEQRGDYVTRVKQAAAEGLAQNGLELETVAITDLDQTDLEYFNPSNRFDAEGLTQLIQEIETRRKLRNDIEQESMILIRTRNLEAERQALDIERESETARLNQQRDVEVRRAVQRAELARERALRDTEAEQAQIALARRSRSRASPTSAPSAKRASPPSARCASARSSAPARSRRPRSRRASMSSGRRSPISRRSARRASPPSASAPARDRAHPHGRGGRDRGARAGREGAHRAGARRHRGAHRQRGRDAPARHRAHPRGRRGRDRGARGRPRSCASHR
jgi:hypothetical protein